MAAGMYGQKRSCRFLFQGAVQVLDDLPCVIINIQGNQEDVI